MIYIFTVIIALYVYLLFSCTRKMVSEIAQEKEAKINELKRNLHGLEAKKDSLYKEKMDLQAEAVNIFTLYEITKDITKSLSEKEAFEMFKQRLAAHVQFVECLFLMPDEPKLGEMRKDSDYFLFSIIGKKSEIGFLAIKGVSEEEKEKVSILATQFALALRRVELYQEIEEIAITDSLTEVHTRRYILERLQEEINRSKAHKLNCAILMIDVDHFKKFNDTFGHLTGDQILREIGRIISENLREIDIAGRYGGEEFCIVLPDTDMQGAQFAAERIRTAAESSMIKAYDTTIQATVSIGISQFPKDGNKSSEIIDKADWALYRAKKQGRNRVCSFGMYDEN